MRLRNIFLTGLCLLLVPGFEPSVGARNTGTITKIESRRLPAAEVKRRTLEQLSRILVLEPYPATTERPKLPLSDLWFWTKTRETFIPGLCAADNVTVYFRPVRLPTIGADTPTAAESIQAKTLYRFVVPPKSPVLESRNLPFGRDNPDCRRLDPQHAHMFNAPDEGGAVEGIWLVGEITARLQQGNADFKLSCTFSEKQDECVRFVKQMKPEEIVDIDRCQADANENVTEHCIEASTFGQQLRVFADGYGAKEKIIRVEADELVTTADLRAD